MKYCNAEIEPTPEPKVDLEFGNIVWYLDTKTKNIIWAVDGEDNKEYYSFLGVKQGSLGYPEHLNHYDMWFTNNFPFPQVKGFIKLYEESEDCFMFKLADIETDFHKWKKTILAGRISSDGDAVTAFSETPKDKKDLRLVANFFLKKDLINANTSLYWNEEFQGPASFILGGEDMLSNVSVENEVKQVNAQSEISIPSSTGESKENPRIVDLIQRYRGGDKEAGESLLQQYDKAIRGVWYAFLRKIGASPENPKAEDALQEAYLYFLDRMKRDYDPEKSKVTTFIYTNLPGIIQNHFNPQRNKEDLLEIDTPNNTERNEGENDKGLDQISAPEEKDDAGHIAERAEAIISQYPEREQQMVRDFFYNGKTLQKIGDEFQVSRERVRQIINDIILRIRRDPKVKEHAPSVENDEQVKLGMIFNDEGTTSKLCNKA